MLRQARHTIIRSLFETYRANSSQMQAIENGLQQKGATNTILDHCALIDLPSAHTGIHTMLTLFSAIGYIERGKGYLPEKQNDFLWMAEADSMELAVTAALPQIVIADFRPEELPDDVRAIIEKYAEYAPPPPITKVIELAKRTQQNDLAAMRELIDTMVAYCTKRDWPLPTVAEFATVNAWNKLLAWVLVFGRSPNHFTLSLQHLNLFADIGEFHHYVEHELNIDLNHEGGKIKGTQSSGLMQGSTQGSLQRITLSDGYVTLPTGFVEFVWRYPTVTDIKPTQWNHYFTGFIAANADYVIESLTTG